MKPTLKLSVTLLFRIRLLFLRVGVGLQFENKSLVTFGEVKYNDYVLDMYMNEFIDVIIVVVYIPIMFIHWRALSSACVNFLIHDTK